MPAFDLFLRNTSEVLTVSGDWAGGADRALAPLPSAVIGIANGRIAYLGSESGLPKDALAERTETVDAVGGLIGPGFVDPHTHLVFAGDRSAEFEQRCRGATYLEIARAGGGIASTVRATRAASEDELVALSRGRVRALLEQGVTCAEVKSGYGLDLAQELKMLRAIRRLSAVQPVELVPTLLCAHAVPPEMQRERDRYVRQCAEEIIPAVVEAKLARFCDAFVDEGGFTRDEGRRILRAGAAMGLVPRLHADQLSDSRGAELAAELGASSADHLERISEQGIDALARAGVSAVLMPTTTLFLRDRPFAPGRRLVDGGARVALATNFNPGSAMSENVALTLGLACLENGLTASEAYWAFTRGAALALRRLDLGQLMVGGPADLVVFRCRSHRHLPYHLGVNHVRYVVKNGQVVVRSDWPDPRLCDAAG
jgi:imidazolonepropionase